MYCFGIDIGGTTIKCGLFNDEGKLLNKWSFDTNKNDSGMFILPEIANSIASKSADYGINYNEIRGIGIGAPAPTTENGLVIKAANIGWENKNVKQELESLTGLNVVVDNDANLAAYGEVWCGGGAGYQNAVFVTLGTGIGGSIITNGKILRGANSYCGEIGHLLVNPNETELCTCGRKGCLEQYASGTGIIRLAKRAFRKSKENTMVDPNDTSAKKIFEMAKYGDFVADKIVLEFSKYLGIAFANIAAVLDPEVFIVGGGISQAGDILIDSIKYEYKKNAFFANRNVDFVIAKLGKDAGMYGAAKLALEIER